MHESEMMMIRGEHKGVRIKNEEKWLGIKSDYEKIEVSEIIYTHGDGIGERK